MGDITLENINLVVQGGKTLEESGFAANPTGYADVAMFGEVLPAYGIYANGAKNLSLKNVTVKTLRKDSRPDILVE